MDEEGRREVGLCRYALVRDVADAGLSKAERGRLVRALAEQEHVGPDGRLSGRSRNREASTTRSLSLFLSVSLARTRASGSSARPPRCQGASAASAQSRALAALSFSRPLHQPGTGIPAGTDEKVIVLHLLSHGASWRTLDFLGFHHRRVRVLNPRYRHVTFLARWPTRQKMQHAATGSVR